ncbi:hypothetical protein [Marispirochaeta sp.]|uniref:hypothetical protein n=1 Tax=Marispirochaeta sp. TaxID=2038653 RepID=UPI0029C79898|nr:hypothetical protein [Marispirochaeta sp.]
MSSDYVESLEMGEEPEVGSEYWVFPFIQEIFDNTIKKYRPDIAIIIMEKSNMQLK